MSVLLKYLLSNAIVDTALVTRLEKEGNRLVPRSRFIESADEVDAFKGSVYVQTRPAELIDMNFIKSDRRAVLVGLPCHVQSVALMKKRFPKLNGRLFAIGLFCSHNATRDNLTYVLKNLHKTESELDSFNFRVPGWGYQDSFLTGWINHWFCQKGCMYCQDVFSDFADISVGDACLDRLMQEKECDGYSITIARNEVSQQWCRELEDMGRLTLAPVSCEDIVACHTFPILHKIRSFAFRCRILPYMTTGVPRAGNQRLSLKDMVVIVGLEISGILSKAPGISGLLRILPFRLMRSIQRRIGGMM